MSLLLTASEVMQVLDMDLALGLAIYRRAKEKGLGEVKDWLS